MVDSFLALVWLIDWLAVRPNMNELFSGEVDQKVGCFMQGQ
jgi:hypothetical protein